MATIASLYVNLTASTASFTTQMEKAGKKLRAFGLWSLNLAKQIATIGAAGAAIAVAGLVALERAAAGDIDRIGKLSDRLGVSTELLVGWSHGANLAGVEAEAFEKALERMNRMIGEAAIKGGETQRVLEQMGLDAGMLANLRTDEQFTMIADAIASIQNPAERALAAYTLFGRQGQQLVNLLATGSAGLAEAVAEAERLGLTFSRLDAAKVEQANDSITRLQALFKGVGTQLAVQVAPILTAITARFLQFATTGDSLRDKVGGALKFIAKGAGVVAEIGRVIGIVWNGLRTVVSTAAGVAVQALYYIVKAANAVTGQFEQSLAAVEGFRDGLRDVALESARTTVDLVTNFGGYAEAVDDFLIDVERTAEAAAEPVLKLNEAFEDLGVTFEALDEQARALEDLQRAAERVYEETRTPLEKFAAEQEKLDELLRRELISLETYERAMQKAREELEALTGAREDDAAARDSARDEGVFKVVDRALIDFDRRMGDPNRTLVPKIDRSNDLLASIDRGIRSMTEQGVA